MGETYENLRFERDGAVAILTLDRPKAGNAININMARELMLAAILCDRDEGIRAVLLRSKGKLFCAGEDIDAWRQLPPISI